MQGTLASAVEMLAMANLTRRVDYARRFLNDWERQIPMMNHPLLFIATVLAASIALMIPWKRWKRQLDARRGRRPMDYR